MVYASDLDASLEKKNLPEGESRKNVREFTPIHRACKNVDSGSLDQRVLVIQRNGSAKLEIPYEIVSAALLHRKGRELEDSVEVHYSRFCTPNPLS